MRKLRTTRRHGFRRDLARFRTQNFAAAKIFENFGPKSAPNRTKSHAAQHADARNRCRGPLRVVSKLRITRQRGFRPKSRETAPRSMPPGGAQHADDPPRCSTAVLTVGMLWRMRLHVITNYNEFSTEIFENFRGRKISGSKGPVMTNDEIGVA